MDEIIAAAQHVVTASRTAVRSIITCGGKWVEMTIPADPLYQHLLPTAERKFWGCVETAEPARLFGIEPPRPRVDAVRVVDMSGSNSWAEFADNLSAKASKQANHFTVADVEYRDETTKL